MPNPVRTVGHVRRTSIAARLRACAAGLLATAATLIAPPARAQQALPAYDIPRSAAFDFLGASPEKVSKPTTARGFAADLLSGIGQDGRLAEGLAVSVAPLRAILWRVPDSDAYGKALLRAVQTLDWSVGTVRASGDSGSTDLATGLRMVFFDRSDPYTDTAFSRSVSDRVVRECYRPAQGTDDPLLNSPGTTLQAVRRYSGITPLGEDSLAGAVVVEDTVELVPLDSTGRALPPERAVLRRLAGGAPRAVDTVAVASPFVTPAQRSACGTRVRAAEAKAWVDRHWNGASLGFGIAAGWRFQQSSLTRGDWSGWALWGVGGFPIGQRVSIEGQLRVDERTVRAGTGPEGTNYSAGIRARAGGPQVQAFLEGTNTTAAHARPRWSLSFGVDLRVAKGVWFTAGLGSAYDALGGRRRVVVLSNLRTGVFLPDPQSGAEREAARIDRERFEERVRERTGR